MAHGVRVLEPPILGLDQTVISLRSKLPVLPASHPVDRVAQVLGDVEFVEHDLLIRFRDMGSCGGDEGRPHVHRDVLESRAALRPEILEVALQNLLAAVVGHMQDNPLVEIIDDSDVLVALLKRRFVHANRSRRPPHSPSQPPPHGTRLDPRYLIPRQSKLPRHGQGARFMQPVDHQRFEQRRVP